MEFVKIMLKYPVHLFAPVRFFPLKIVFIVNLIVAAVSFILYEWRQIVIIIIHLPIWRKTSFDRLVGP